MKQQRQVQESRTYAIVGAKRDATFLDEEDDLLDKYEQKEHVGRLDRDVGNIFNFLDMRLVWREHVEHGPQDVPLFVQNLAFKWPGSVHFARGGALELCDAVCCCCRTVKQIFWLKKGVVVGSSVSCKL